MAIPANPVNPRESKGAEFRPQEQNHFRIEFVQEIAAGNPRVYEDTHRRDPAFRRRVLSERGHSAGHRTVEDSGVLR